MNGRNKYDNRITVLMGLMLSLLFTTALGGLKDVPKLFFILCFHTYTKLDIILLPRVLLVGCGDVVSHVSLKWMS